jgi:formate dehydrogenase accessory protein FdhD
VSGTTALPALRCQADATQAVDEEVVVELPIALRYNAAPFAVMLATPTDLEDFALGFSLSEGIIASAAELRDLACERSDAGVSIEMSIPQARFDALEARRRSIGGYSGCGLCGTESLQAAMRPVPPVADTLRVDPSRVYAAAQALSALQPLNARTGGVHAAAWVGDGARLVREDVGRHNALDKLVGALARQSSRGPGFLLMTSRASYEIVHKAACAGIEMVVAISAPTTLAIRTAEAAGITLCAFLRGDAMNVYCGAARLRGDG